MVKLYCINVNTMTKEEIDSLSLIRKEKASRYMFEKDKKLSLAAGIAFARGLKEYRLKESEVRIGYSKYDKPYLIDYPDIHFNLSHSGEMAIAVFSDNEVGCDIEQIRKLNVQIVQSCFTNEENNYISKNKNKDLAFTRIWTCKESFLKATGRGLNTNLKGCEILFKKGVFYIRDEKYVTLQTLQNEDYVISICEIKQTPNKR